MQKPFFVLTLGIAGMIAVTGQEAPPPFEVASLKLAPPDGGGFQLFWLPGGRFFANNASLKGLVIFAYDVRGNQISGGPNWLESDRYTIEARTDSKTQIPEGFAAGDSFRLMVRSLLVERFKLTVQRQSRQEQIYKLLVGKGGPELKEAATFTQQGLFPGRGRLDGKAARMGMLAKWVSGQVGRAVFDKTGLSGNYDFTLTYALDTPAKASADSAANAAALSDDLGPTSSLRYRSNSG